jgi:outer membrane protein assembly factor BamB
MIRRSWSVELLVSPEKSMTFLRWATVSVALLLLAFPVPMLGEDDSPLGWFQYRGPNRDGKSTETGLVHGWSPNGPREVWRVPVGTGFAPISIVGNRVYSMNADEQTEFALCLDAETGETIWRVPMGPIFKDSNGDGPRSGPTVDGDRAFMLASRGRLAALDAATGETIWQLEYQEVFDSELPTWGFSTAPLVDGDLLIVEVGGSGARSIAALDKRTGETRWTAQESNIVYSSPIRLDFGGIRQFVFVLQDEIVGLNREGAELWSVPFAPQGTIKPAMPLFIAPDQIMAAASYDIGAKVVKLTADGATVTAEEAWSSRYMRNHFNTSIALDGYIYGFDAATLRCMDARTGERGWAKRGLGKGSLILADGMFIVLSERGKLVLLEATSEDYRELAAHQVLEGRCWTPPSLWEGRLYLRNHTDMVCLDLREGTPE